jgi:hypothetical protein
MGLVLGGGGGGGGGGSSRAAKAQSEAVLEASLELVHAAARLRAAPAASARTVGTILDACGPERLGALLAPSASVPEDMRLSPPRREQLMRVASALLSSQWKALMADEVRLSSVMGLLAAGLDGVETRRDPGPRRDIDMYTQGHTLEGIRRLPANLLDALRAFAADEVLRARLGASFGDSYLKLKQDEWARFARHLTEWERETTLDC